ncbi:MAG: S-methyl-5'-thioinosine phosphorylase [Thermoproteota archaeon]|jgi:5'-methylthioadenosine phosphorylase
MKKATLVVIGGSGTSDLFPLEESEEVSTPYGKSLVYWVRVAGRDVAFISRHGLAHSLPPHKVNYRANIYTAKQLSDNGYVVATNAVGSLNKRMRPGELVLADQVIDFTKGRTYTFFDGANGKVVHTDVTFPFSSLLTSKILMASKKLGLRIHPKGTYVCTEGPRFETAAEIKMFKKIGGDLVGMTLVPEVFLAKELSLEYASICIVTNWAAGIAKKVSSEEVLQVMKNLAPKLKLLLEETIKLI